MAGNTINMYGGSYVDIHDNEVVNLNIDKAEVKVNDVRGKMSDVRGKMDEAASVLTSNGAFMEILNKAVALGFCSLESERYKWGVKVEAAYFASVASQVFELSKKHDRDGDVMMSWKPFEALFGEKNLRLTYNDYQKCATRVKRKAEIDALFR
ncbi:MAG: hypothetical protein K5867_06805 [Bacteroidales bacterium]|nr:hypothetical protein [Bacteroidales bacterium]